VTEPKTLPTDADPAAFVAAVPDPTRRRDAETLLAMLAEVSGEPPVVWGDGLVGFGRYRYRYASGREGDWPRIAFSPRKAQSVLYLMDGFDGREELLSRLGPHRTGASCLYLKRLADVDPAVLAELCRASLARMAALYPLPEGDNAARDPNRPGIPAPNPA
jgi:hypothetical protein